MRTLKQYYGKYRWLGVKLYLIKKIGFPRIINIDFPGLKDTLTLRPDTSDLDVFQQVFIEDEYDFVIDEDPDVIVDAGANIGLASIFYAIKYPNAKIIAIEPESSNCDLLKKNIQNYSNITSIQKALWHVNTRLKISNPNAGKFAFRVEESSNGQEVSSITIEDLLKEYDLPFIDILKIDIEGAEKEVFSNTPDWIAKVGLIAIELHEYLKTGCNRAFYTAIDSYTKIECKKGENVFVVTSNLKND